MERALLEVEHNNELKIIQNDEAKLKHLQQEHQTRLDAFNRHTQQIRNEIEMIQMTIKNIENEILILDTTLDKNYLLLSSANNFHHANTNRMHMESLKAQKEHSLEEAKHIHEDLEFQLMELEAKYETELEDIQNRLIKEQDHLLNVFKQRQASLSELDQQQTQMLLKCKTETDLLEIERLKLIDEFKKQREQLDFVEKKIKKLRDCRSPLNNNEHIVLDSEQKTVSNDNQTPSPASSSISLSSNSNSNSSNNETTTSSSSASASSATPSSSNQIKVNFNQIQTPQRFLYSQAPVSTIQHNLSQSFMDILENTLLINNMAEDRSQRTNYMSFKSVNSLIDTTNSVNTQPHAHNSTTTATTKNVTFNNNDEVHEIILHSSSKQSDILLENGIKLRDNSKKKTQARPLTRYLPVRDHNFDLKQHVENSGHQLCNQFDPHTKQPLIYLNQSTCRGYLLKMGHHKFRTWNKRWFVFDRQKRTLSYFMDKNETKLRATIYFQSINEVYVDHMRTIKSPDAKSTFVVKTQERNFYLVAPTSELMRIWVDVIFTGAEGYLEFND
jgi:hypothetical protein